MSDLLEAVDAAGTPSAYIQAVGQLWRELAQRRWVIGEVLVSPHAHHATIPDASGRFDWGGYWAIYSQPGPASLKSQARMLAESLTRTNVLSHRYLLFCLRGSVLHEEVRAQFDEQVVDLYADSVEEIMRTPRHLDLMRGFDVVAGAADGPHRAMLPVCERITFGALATFRDDRAAVPAGSTIPTVMWTAYRDSTVVLTAVREQLDERELLKLLEERAALALHLAHRRARAALAPELDRLASLAAEHPLSVKRYEVRPGDTLSQITVRELGLAYETVLPLILACNPSLVDPNKIRAGQSLNLPVMA